MASEVSEIYYVLTLTPNLLGVRPSPDDFVTFDINSTSE